MAASRVIAVALLALGLLAPQRAAADLQDDVREFFEDVLHCPRAQILCLRKLGYNWQKCGRLTGERGAAQEFPLCRAADGYACVPCWFGSVAETAARCRATFGPDCGHFVERDAHWQGNWGDFAWPEDSPLFLLFGGGPH